MSDEFPFEPELMFGAADDQLHEPGPEQNWTEAAFFSFHVAERALGGWLYVNVRPNIGTVQGGAFVYDPTAWLPWDVPYSAFFHHQPMPDPCDLRDITLPTGVSMTCLEPAMRYRIGYQLADRTDFRADLEFVGLTPPIPHVSGEPPFETASHFDQHGRVTGTIELDGVSIPVDCISVRDRSWGPRPEIRPYELQLGYCFGATSAHDGFLAFAMAPPSDPMSETFHLFGGYRFKDGRTCRLTELTRVNHRDPATGGVARIELDGVDTDDRPLRCTGTSRSRYPLPLGKEFAMMSLVEWVVDDGKGGSLTGWGEDQEVIPHGTQRARLRALRP